MVAIATAYVAASVSVATLVATRMDGAAAAPPSPPPNIVMIVTDDQPISMMRFLTKVQQHIVDEGISFDNALYSLPLCCPTRATVFRGQNANNTGVKNNTAPHGGFAKFHTSGQEADTLATWMKAAGYTTAFMGKYFNGYPTAVSGLGIRYATRLGRMVRFVRSGARRLRLFRQPQRPIELR